MVVFNVGVAFGEVFALFVAFAAVSVVLTYVLGYRPWVIVISVLVGHAAWRWITDDAHRLEHAIGLAMTIGSPASIVWWVLLGLLVGGLAWFLPKSFETRPARRAGPPREATERSPS